MGEIRKVIGENIKKICSLKGIRQVDIAEHMGVSLDQIYGMSPITPEVSLSNEETELLSLYRSLTREGQSLVMGTIRTFAGNPAMQKDGRSASAM